MKKVLGVIFKVLPEGLQKIIIACICKVSKKGYKGEGVQRLELRVGFGAMRRYVRKLFLDWDKEVERLKGNHRFTVIRERCPDNFFHGCLVSMIVEKTIWAMQKGYIPIFEIVYTGRNETHSDCRLIQMDWVLEQPCKSIFGIDVESINQSEIFENEELQKDCCPYRIEGKIFWKPECKELKIWNFLYRKVLVKSKSFSDYVQKDIVTNQIPDKDILGILIRGTDYTKLKPKLHPVQPEVADVIKKAEELMHENHYQKIYVVTDEERAFNQVEEHFGKDMVLANTRLYYDKVFRDKNCYQIADAHAEREDDDFWHSLEYISSLFILSKCDMILGGNCGGSKLAVLLAEHPEKAEIFNLGVY